MRWESLDFLEIKRKSSDFSQITGDPWISLPNHRKSLDFIEILPIRLKSFAVSVFAPLKGAWLLTLGNFCFPLCIIPSSFPSLGPPLVPHSTQTAGIAPIPFYSVKVHSVLQETPGFA